MKPLVKVMLILGSLFALTFVAGRLLGILTVENVKQWLEMAASIDPYWLAGTVILLLFLDLFVAVPTLTITILAGYFLGFPAGAAAALTGMSLAAFSGYFISSRLGERPISLLVRDADDRQHMADTFQRNGPVMIILSRAAPIVPEVTACMAGATNMNFGRYLMFFGLSTLPYVGIAAYAGSISSIESPQPAILAVLFLYATLWLGWYLFQRKSRKATES
jgi:uncharacterized membrane protein YdjX (TVP38/TMEM64 family)